MDLALCHHAGKDLIKSSCLQWREILKLQHIPDNSSLPTDWWLNDPPDQYLEQDFGV